MEYDLVVVGGGLAGLTAALYGARYGLRTVIVEQMMAGGQIVNVQRIEDFPGFAEGVAGAELGAIAQEQAEAAGAQFVFDEVTSVERTGDGFTVHAAERDYTGRTVIAASGSSRRALDVPGDTAFRGRGVSECAGCDGSFFVGQRVAVIGGGDSALSEAILLADQRIAEVLLVHRGNALDAQKVWQDRLSERDTIKLHLETEVVEILGEDGVSGIVLSHAGETRKEDVQGVFPYVGLAANSGWLGDLVELDAEGRVVVDGSLMSSVAGLFAAGDIRQNSMAQLIASAGDGASAAVAAVRHLAGVRH